MSKRADLENAAKRGTEIDVLARTLWGEARGEGVDGMMAVACVIANRVRRPSWWGAGWIGVCQKPWQFSCWNRNDPNREKLLTVGPDDAQFSQALTIAAQAVDNRLPDITGGATHYHARSVLPAWQKHMQHTASIGRHEFYKEA